jgi:hypothetical protein
MNESRLWGGLGVLLAVAGLAVIVPEFVAGLSHGGLTEPTVLYGLAVAVAVVLTLLVLLPGMIRG